MQSTKFPEDPLPGRGQRTASALGSVPDPATEVAMASRDDDGTPTLVDWTGGPPALARLIDAFYDRVERDDLLSPFFPGGVSAEHRRHVAAWWTEVRRVDRVHRPAGRLRAALVGYLEWGTRLAAENSQRGAAPAEHAPVPRWGRGVAPPYVP